jgi:molybdopterin converting factor small subunit
MNNTAEEKCMIEVLIKYFSQIREQTRCGQEPIRLSEGSRLSDLVGQLNERYGFSLHDEQVMVVLNGRGWRQLPEGMETVLKSGDVVLLTQPLDGG